MTAVKGNLGQDPQSGDDGQEAAARAILETPRWRIAARRTRELARHHPVFAVALAAAVVPRLVAMLGYQPAILFRMDSFDYLWGALHLSPNVINPSGYSIFLWPLHLFHSLALVAALQHLMGLGMAVMIYALLRRYGLPGWGATLAATPSDASTMSRPARPRAFCASVRAPGRSTPSPAPPAWARAESVRAGAFGWLETRA